MAERQCDYVREDYSDCGCHTNQGVSARTAIGEFVGYWVCHRHQRAITQDLAQLFPVVTRVWTAGADRRLAEREAGEFEYDPDATAALPDGTVIRRASKGKA